MRTVFPIAALATEEGEMARPDYFGTAFAIRRDLLGTAAHVIEAAAAVGTPSVGDRQTTTARWVWRRSHGGELFKDRDFALLFMEQALPVTVLSKWLAARVQFLTDLSSFGYPHSVTRELDGADRFDVVFRAYRGHVVTTRGFERLPGRPAIDEMSCPYPEGMSGAPALLNTGEDILVAGVVVGSSNVLYGGVNERVGVAIVADELLALESRELGGKVMAMSGLTLVGGSAE